jgi:hypothetical protein
MANVAPKRRFFRVALEHGVGRVKGPDLSSPSEEDSTVMLNVLEDG